MNPKPRNISSDDQDLIAQYLKAGGSVTVNEPGAVTVDFNAASSWNHRRAKQKPQDETK
jgi:hypothetical protein